MDGGGNNLYYILRDHLGSASATLDASGTVVANSEQRYYPFGESRFASASPPTDRLYTGQRLVDGLGGLYHYNARWYLPKLGRFISADTLVPEPDNPQALNRYSYVLNNPVQYTDPTGHCAGPALLFCIVGLLLIGGSIPGDSQYHPDGNLNGAALGSATISPFADFGLTMLDCFVNGCDPYLATLSALPPGPNPTWVSKLDDIPQGASSGAFLADETFPYDAPGSIYGQMEKNSCVAASCRMVIKDVTGIDYPEAYIRVAANVDTDGGFISQAPDALAQVGVSSTYKPKISVAELESATYDGMAIVSVRTRLTRESHALIVDGISNGMVLIRDPLPHILGSSYKVELGTFLQAWDRQVVIVDP